MFLAWRQSAADHPLRAIAGIGAAVVLTAGLWLIVASPFKHSKPPHLVTGTFTIRDAFSNLGNTGLDAVSQMNELNGLLAGQTYDCSTGVGGGYSDIADGTSVTVKDQSGNLIAATTLTGGVLSQNGCSFDFSLSVPDKPFYEVEVSSRGASTYTRAQLAAGGWHVDLGLGG